MSSPVPVPAWLRVEDVKTQLQLDAADVADDALVTACSAAVEPQVERARSDQFGGTPPTFLPDWEVYQAAVMLAARLVRRRNSPAGVETFGESVLYASRYDPDIARALRQGAPGSSGYAMPTVA
jgi:hypothetical protein